MPYPKVSDETMDAQVLGRVVGTQTFVPLAVTPGGAFAPPTALNFNRSGASVATVPLALAANATPLEDSIFVSADPLNTETIFLGGAGVTVLTGTGLAAGLGIAMSIDDLAKVFFVDSGGGGQRVRWIGG